MTPARVGPRDALERSVRNIWADLLGHRDFGVHDSFFTIGGTSVEMLTVQQLISELCGYELALAELFSAPTIAGAALLMRGSARAEPSALVPLSPGGDGTPVFCFHPLGGSAAVYFPLAQALADRPVYGLQSVGLTAGTAPQATMTGMVSTYLAAIREVCPRGPYVLLGYSLGGIIAFAVAQEIIAQDGEGPVVTLIDTPPDTNFGPADPYRAVGGYALNLDLDFDALAQSGKEQAVNALYAEALRVGVFGPAFPVERLQAIFDTALANKTAAATYLLRRYEGEVLLVHAGSREDFAGWKEYADRLTWHAVPLPHAFMLEEKAARRIAVVLSEYLAATNPVAR